MTRHLPAWCLLVFSLATSCSSVSWSDTDSLHGTPWRDREAYVSGEDIVLAVTPSAAASVAEAAAELRARCIEFGGEEMELGTILWVAVDSSGEPLFDDPRSLVETLGVAHAAFTGNEVPPTPPLDAGFGGAGGDDEDGRVMQPPTEAEKLELAKRVSRSFAAASNSALEELALPATLISRSEMLFVYPTDEGLSALADHLLDFGLARTELSIMERMALPLVRGFAHDKVQEPFLTQRRSKLAEALLAHLGVDPKGTLDENKASFRAILEALEIIEPGSTFYVNGQPVE